MPIFSLTLLTQHRAVHQETQILLFSATFPDEVMKFAQRFAPNANEIKLKHEELTVAGISQMYMDCPSEVGKYEILVKLYGLMTIGSSIIFCKVRTDLVGCVSFRLILHPVANHSLRNREAHDCGRSQGCCSTWRIRWC